MNVLIVESPSKAKSINKYLGSGFKVLASVGHVRDLPADFDPGSFRQSTGERVKPTKKSNARLAK